MLHTQDHHVSFREAIHPDSFLGPIGACKCSTANHAKPVSRKKGEDDLQNPAAHHPQLMSLCSNIVVNVTQSCYQAEENHNITLEWTFTKTSDYSPSSLFILCELIAPHRPLVLYQVHEGVEVSESQDEQFSGRVQSDKDVLREGRIRLHVSRLRTEDSGLYQCDVMTDDGVGSARCRVRVTDPKLAKTTRTETVPHRTLSTPTPQETISTGQRSRLLLCFPVIVLIISLSSFFFCKYKKSKNFQKSLLSQASTLQSGCLAQGQTCIDVDGSFMKSSLLHLSQGSDSNQQLQPHRNPG
ncbi:hypothetical protein ATANTOWER_006648 [Ataeniobius toweri]|uniref:Immunoglobulin V-set domain-containing protein n=1 Tax=Ataeniobius toweri TaxID=208326 RepID=A0ABU7C9L3_9TELE|nr:hypothetical protein [Ataeniobius toweri]